MLSLQSGERESIYGLHKCGQRTATSPSQLAGSARLTVISPACHPTNMGPRRAATALPYRSPFYHHKTAEDSFSKGIQSSGSTCPKVRFPSRLTHWPSAHFLQGKAGKDQGNSCKCCNPVLSSWFIWHAYPKKKRTEHHCPQWDFPQIQASFNCAQIISFRETSTTLAQNEGKKQHPY